MSRDRKLKNFYLTYRIDNLGNRKSASISRTLAIYLSLWGKINIRQVIGKN